MSRVRSVAAMYLLHALNLGVPLITLPFLTRHLGPEPYAWYGVVLSWAAFATLLIDFGFGVEGTKRLAADDGDGTGVGAQVLVHQTLNAAIVLPVLWLAMQVPGGPPLSEAGRLLALGVAWIVGISPIWWYIARSEVTRLAVPSIAAKLVCLAAVVVVLPIWPSIELALFAYFASHAWALAGLWPMRAAARAPGLARLAGWRSALARSAAVPAQRLGSTLYMLLPVTLMASFFGLREAGMFVLADRIVRAVTNVFQPLTSHLLPLQIRAASCAADDPLRTRVQRISALVIAGACCAGGMLLLLSEVFMVMLGGEAFRSGGTLLAGIAPLVPLIVVNMLLLNRLTAQDREALIARAVWGCGLMYLVLVFLVGRHSTLVFTSLLCVVEAAIAVLLWAGSRGREPLGQRA